MSSRASPSGLTQPPDEETFQRAPQVATPQSRFPCHEGHPNFDPFAPHNVAAPGLTGESFLEPGFDSTSLPPLFAFTPDKEAHYWPAPGSLTQDPAMSTLSWYPTTFPSSSDVSLDMSLDAADVPNCPSDLSQVQTRQGQAQIMNSPASLPRRRSRYNIQKLGQTTEARQIPIQTQCPDPLQRWHESPPEDEPASMSAIMQAIQTSTDLNAGPAEGLPTTTYSSFRNYRRPISAASSNSGNSASSWHSSDSRNSASAAQKPLAAQSYDSSIRVGKNGKSRKSNAASQRRNYHCTYCCDSFKNKYDWSRHERTLHLNLVGWMCTPEGGAPVSPTTGRKHCALCHCLDPAPEHFLLHNYTQCSRTFRRKDHLVQHLRLVHRLDVLPIFDTWRAPALVVTSRCGFCECRLNSWDERTDHLASHFRQNISMETWRGEHDFPPAIADMVTNSLPPYLIASESKTVVPFSATNSNVKDHFTQISQRAEGFDKKDAGLTSSFQQLQATEERPLGTFTEILTQHLARYSVREGGIGIEVKVVTGLIAGFIISEDDWCRY